MSAKAVRASLWVVLFLCVAPPPVDAMIIDASEPLDAVFGGLNQNLTSCPSFGCGPAAAVNSFVFLQNQYPNVYTNPLVPKTDPPLVGEVAVANALLGNLFMNCNCNNSGTVWENFILGKENWIEAVDPGTTRYLAQSFFTWDTTMFGAKPGNVTDQTAPSIDFLAGEINHGEDVEVLLNANGGGHYVTVTGLTWNTDQKTGTLNYIDPLDGEPHSGELSALSNGLALSYSSPDLTIIDQRAGITVAISESPKSIAEPSIPWFALATLGLMAIMRGAACSAPHHAHSARANPLWAQEVADGSARR